MIDRIDPSKKNVRKFGILFGVLGLAIAGYLWYRGNSHWGIPVAAGACFFLGAFFGYAALKPVYIGWMMFAAALAWINTRVLLGLFYFLVMTPVGLILRLTGKDLLDQRLNRDARSYWVPRVSPPEERSRYERLF